MGNAMNTNDMQRESMPLPVETENKPQKNKGGRPRKDPSQVLDSKLVNKINEYMSGNKDTCTFSQMGHVLGYSCAADFIEDAKKKKGALGYALSLVENRYESELIGKYSVGAIFALKQLGWADTQKVETEVKAVTVNVSLEASLDDLAGILNPIVEEAVV